MLVGLLFLQGCGVPDDIAAGAGDAADWLLEDGSGVKGEYGVVAVGPIDTPVEQWRRMARIAREGLTERLDEEEGFALVLVPPPRQLPPGAITVKGTIVDVREGDEMARFLVGFGIGRIKIRSRFDIVDEHGDILETFEVTETYRGGTWLSFSEQWHQVYPEEVARGLGHDAAKAVIRFRKGEDVGGPRAFGWL